VSTARCDSPKVVKAGSNTTGVLFITPECEMRTSVGA
jgi:hypothetical protein